MPPCAVISAVTTMRASIPLPQRSLTIWRLAFFSPIAYFVLLLLADMFHVPSPPDALIASLIYLIPAVAFVVYEYLISKSDMLPVRKMTWMLFTLFAVLLQTAILLGIMITASGYAPAR